jgi:hypothetical protein
VHLESRFHENASVRVRLFPAAVNFFYAARPAVYCLAVVEDQAAGGRPEDLEDPDDLPHTVRFHHFLQPGRHFI